MKVRKGLGRYFLPVGGVASYTFRIGILWLAPVLCAYTQLAIENPRPLAESMAFSLVAGFVYGVLGYPLARWSIRIQGRIEQRGREIPRPRHMLWKHFIDLAPLASILVTILAGVLFAFFTLPEWVSIYSTR